VQHANARDLGGTDRVLGTDRASGLAAVRVDGESPTPPPVLWAPRRLERPQFFVATDASTNRVALRPVFISALEPIANALWSEPIWAFSHQNDLLPGSFLFTLAGEFVGIVIDNGGRRAVVPSGIAFAEIERLAKSVTAPAGDLGISAQSLSPDVSAATGATVGVVVNWVDAKQAGVLAIGDVIEAADGQTLSTLEHWRVRLARLGAGDALTLRVRRRGEVRDVRLLAPPPASPVAHDSSLGLRMRRVPGAGAEVLGVQPGSASARAGLAAGDVITFIGGISSPTPAQVRTVFGAAPEGKPTLLAVTRGAAHLVTTVTR
jgi:S1-C subfamily serine protease